jgi:hypothetical protein
MIENWKAVVGFEGLYEVSDLGRVRSLDRILTVERLNWRDGTPQKLSYPRKGRLLKTNPNMKGYPRVTLLANGPTIVVHQLVLNAFVGICPEGLQGLHANDIKSDNRLSNLSWGTPSQNQLDAIKNDRCLLGEEKPNAKLTDADIPTIRSRLKIEGCIAIAKDFGVSDTAIWNIKNGRSWKHVRGDHAA